MNKTFPWRILLGAGLILMGLAALLQTFNLVDLSGWIWGLLFFAGGAVFLSVALNNKANWWGLIPACALFGVGAEIILGSINSPVAEFLSGSMVLGAIGLAFWLIYLLQPIQWWAIIPGGVMVTLAVVAMIGKTGKGLETGGIFMLGLAATFALVAFLTQKTDHSMRWAWIPAGVLAIIGALIFFSAINMMGIIWGLALIGVGGYMAWRALRK